MRVHRWIGIAEEVGESKVEVLSFARSSRVAELVFRHDQHRLHGVTARHRAL